MKNNITLLLSTFLFTSLSTYAMEKEWTEETIKTSLVQSERYAELDLVSDLMRADLSLHQIAYVLGLDESGFYEPPSPFKEKNTPTQELPLVCNWTRERIECTARSKGNQDVLQLIIEGYDKTPDYNKIANIMQFNNDDYILSVDLLRKEAQITSDKKIAALLEGKLNIEDHPQEHLVGSYKRIESRDIPQVKIKTGIILSLKEAQEESKAFDNADVHVYNKGIVVKYIHLYEQICKALNLKNNIPINEIITLLSNYTSGSLNASINKMNSYTLRVEDAETGIRIDHILSCVADICYKISSFSHIRINPYEYVAESLAENIDTQGGCKPGYAGRFFRDFLYLSSIYLENVQIITDN